MNNINNFKSNLNSITFKKYISQHNKIIIFCLALIILLLIIIFILKVPLNSLIPSLIILLCPLSHLFMMKSHGHGHSDSECKKKGGD